MHRPGAQYPPATMAMLDRRPPAPAGQAAAVPMPSAALPVPRKPTVAEDLAARRGETSTSTRTQPPAEAAPASATPTTGRGTRRGRDDDVPPTVERDTSGLDGLPAPRDSKDASGKPYDNAASWMDDRVKKMQALWKKLPEQEQVTPSPYLPP